MKIAKPKECTGCMACVDACAHKVLSPIIDKNGYFRIEADKGACIECGLCTKACPIVSPPIGLVEKSHPFAVWNENDSLRAVSASGGAFSALAEMILRKGGIVYGASIYGFDVKHKRVDRIEDLPSLLGSKYQHSVAVGIYRKVRKDLLTGKTVLFSGMACQVAGLIAFLGKVKRDNLYTVDTICGGLSTMLPMQHLKRCGKDYVAIASFRDKLAGWRSIGYKYDLKMVRSDGSIDDLGLDNLVLNTFSSKLLKRSSCLDCHFTAHSRCSDCTIGDFWGDTKFTNQHPGGVSVLVCHSERMMKVIEESPLHTESISFSDFLPYNHNYYWTHYPLIRYFVSRKLVLWGLRRGKMLKVPTLFLHIYNKYVSIFQRKKEYTKQENV